MAPPEKNNDDDLKLLFACLAYNSSNDIDMDKVATFLGIQKGAAAKRISRLKAKLAKAYNTDDATATPTISTGKKRAKKRGLKTEEEPTPSKKKGKFAMLVDDDGDDDQVDLADIMKEADED